MALLPSTKEAPSDAEARVAGVAAAAKAAAATATVAAAGAAPASRRAAPRRAPLSALTSIRGKRLVGGGAIGNARVGPPN